MRLKDFGRDIITRAARDVTVLPGNDARARDQWCGRTKVDKLHMCGMVEYKIVGLHITLRSS